MREVLSRIISTADFDRFYPALLHEILVAGRSMSLQDAIAIEPWSLDVQDICGNTPLHWAVLKQNSEAAHELIISGAKLDIRDQEGNTPLHWAAFYGLLDSARALLDGGCDIGIQDHSGNNPLLLAVRNEQLDMVRFLLSRGADARSVNRDGQTAFHQTFHTFDGVRDEETLRGIYKLLIQHGADINQPGFHGYTPILYAVRNDLAAAFRVLHRLGARIDIPSQVRKNVLHITACCATLELIVEVKKAFTRHDTQAFTSSVAKAARSFRRRCQADKATLHPGQTRPTKAEIVQFRALVQAIRDPEQENEYDFEQGGEDTWDNWFPGALFT